jgi:hypothetical protein
MQLWRSEGFADQATELHRQFLAILVDFEDDCLTRVTDFHLIMRRGLLYVQQHVLQRYILHGNAPFMQQSHSLDSLFYEKLRMRFVEAVRFLFQSL